MIEFCDLFDKYKLLKMNSTSKWSEPDSAIITNCILNKFKHILEQCILQNEKIILLIDLNIGEFPPLFEALNIAKFFYSLNDILKKSLNYTIIYVKSSSKKAWIDNILKLYTPVRPLKFIQTSSELENELKLISGTKRNGVPREFHSL